MGAVRRIRCLTINRIGLLAAFVLVSAAAQDSHQDLPKQEPPSPTLSRRPAPKPKNLSIPEGKIKLDVVVNDASGNPVIGLEPWEFKVLDNGLPRKLISFSRFDGLQTKPEPPVEVVLVGIPPAKADFDKRHAHFHQPAGHQATLAEVIVTVCRTKR